MSQHLALGPQGEPLICASEEEARKLEARNKPKRTERRTVENIDDEEQQVCPTCGRPKLAAEEEDDEV